MDENLPKPQDQGQDVAKVDVAGDSAPHGGQEQDSQPDQEPMPKLEAPGPGQQEGWQPEDPTNVNQM